jgi:cyclopropane fatty-acyl-phospholipid synthase-like methyltransferase
MSADRADPVTSPAAHTDQVRRYYDHSSALFERLGQGGTSIHRAVWGPGVHTREAAFHYVDELLLAQLRPLGGRPRVVDLGCGLGASLLYLAARLPVHAEGITISARQAERAAALVAAAPPRGDVEVHIRCRQGDYLTLPPDITGMDLAFAIEAFVHSPDSAGFFRSAARALRPGGKLILCDDFLSVATPPPAARHRRWLDEFREGWRTGTLITTEAAAALARVEGLTLVESQDLTPHLELRRPRDRAIGALLSLLRPLRIRGEYWRGLRGGHALQLALRAGLLQYRVLTFERQP